MSALTPKERRVARRLLAAIQEFRRLDPDMQLPMAATLMIVALKEGVSRTEVMEDLKVAGSTATRNLAGLMRRGGEEGLISKRVNPKERRWRLHTLTPEGRAIIKRLTEILEPDEASESEADEASSARRAPAAARGRKRDGSA